MKTIFKHKTMKTTLILLMTLLLATGCTKDEHKDPQTIRFTEIGKGYLSGNGDEGIEKSNLVIKTKTEWETLMQKMNTSGNVTDNFTETDIDFNTYMVIAVFLDLKPTAWEVDIIKIIEGQNNITVYKSQQQFDATVIAQPYCIIKISPTNKEVVFNLKNHLNL